MRSGFRVVGRSTASRRGLERGDLVGEGERDADVVEAADEAQARVVVELERELAEADALGPRRRSALDVDPGDLQVWDRLFDRIEQRPVSTFWS